MGRSKRRSMIRVFNCTSLVASSLFGSPFASPGTPKFNDLFFPDSPFSCFPENGELYSRDTKTRIKIWLFLEVSVRNDMLNTQRWESTSSQPVLTIPASGSIEIDGVQVKPETPETKVIVQPSVIKTIPTPTGKPLMQTTQYYEPVVVSSVVPTPVITPAPVTRIPYTVVQRPVHVVHPGVLHRVPITYRFWTPVYHRACCVYPFRRVYI